VPQKCSPLFFCSNYLAEDPGFGKNEEVRASYYLSLQIYSAPYNRTKQYAGKHPDKNPEKL